MKIQDIIKNSVYGTIGYVSENHILYLPQYLEYNKFILSLFDNIIVCYSFDNINFNEVKNIWKSFFGDKVQFYSIPNKGHTISTMELDNLVIEKSKNLNKKYTWKTSSDIIFFPQILEKQIIEADFYYLNGIGIGGLQQYNFDYNKIINEYFFPQTNFYIINNKIDYINNTEEINKGYELQKQNPNRRLWELISGFECETFLKRCVERNNLTKIHLIDEYNYKNLLFTINKYNIVDPSHKNLIINDIGVCHLHYPGEPCYSIEILKNHI